MIATNIRSLRHSQKKNRMNVCRFSAMLQVSILIDVTFIPFVFGVMHSVTAKYDVICDKI